MKISYNWLKDYIDTQKSIAEISDVLTSTGLEVEGVELVESVKGGLKGVVVGEVVECIKHPDADRLRLTKVNIGNEEQLQIVCGAPNVAVGQKVLVATIGTTLFPTSGEALNIKKGKIRGQESHGMICAEDELGIGISHDGIMVLDAMATVGTAASEYLNIKEDHCIEIGLTPNRTDAFSHFGVARDLAAALRNMRGIANENALLKKPTISDFKPSNAAQRIKVSVMNTEACPRYSSLTIQNVKVQDSPEWLQQRLTTIGLRPINNVVDITNYVQHELGQPLHAFDASTIANSEIIVRAASENEKFVTLDGIERTLHTDDLMICDAEKPLCIAGVFGGLNSGVTEKTTTVFLESACFNPVYVRKTSKRHALKTDASFRFERGVDVDNVVFALQRAASLISSIASGEVADSINDIYTVKAIPKVVDYNWKRAARLIGADLEKSTVKTILNDLDISVQSENEEGLQLVIPFYRTDVTREADVIEEVLRIYGFNNVEIPKRMMSSMGIAKKPDADRLQNRVADLLSNNGFNEMMSMSLTRSRYANTAVDESIADKQAVSILNPLSSDLGILRKTLLHSALEAVSLNQNHRNTDIRAFEFGNIFFKDETAWREQKQLVLFMSGRRSVESWNNGQDEVSFNDLKGILEKVMKMIGLNDLQYESYSGTAFSDGVKCRSGKNLIGAIGCVGADLLKEHDIKQAVWLAEINWDGLLKATKHESVNYEEPVKFPAVRRDLSLLLDKGINYAQIEQAANEAERKLLRSVNLFDVYEGKGMPEGKKSYAVSFTLQDNSKTMQDAQVDSVMKKIQQALEDKLGATLRS